VASFAFDIPRLKLGKLFPVFENKKPRRMVVSGGAD
jgi:hypothetical protein